MIDIKTLRVGSHVNLCGKRQHIMTIDALNGAIGMCGYLTDENGVKHPLGYKVEDIEPIPITPALLKELGFEQDMRFAYGKAFKMERGEMWIGVSAMPKGFWRIEAMDDTYNYGNCIVRYLHEAEAFLALHNIELIEE